MKRLLFILTICIASSCNRIPSDFAVTDDLMRSDLVKMSLPEQRSVFSMLDPEMKVKLYQFKIRKDLKEKELTRQERKILKEILDYCKSEVYENLSENQSVENEFVMKLDALGWSEEKIFKYTMVVMTVDEFEVRYQ